MSNKEQREIQFNKFYSTLPTYEEMFTFKNMLNSFYKCCGNVMWKETYQRYRATAPLKIQQLSERMEKEDYAFRTLDSFYKTERGKTRLITPPSLEERVVQKVLCDYYLVPLLSRSLIHDNGATIKGKGTTFTLNRLKRHLYDYYSKNKTNEGYILVFDFTNYFGNIDHQLLFEMFEKKIRDQRIINLLHAIIDNEQHKGLDLGSQVSQISAVYYPNKIDHYFKDFLRVKYYGRYMDDGYIISDSKEKLLEYKEDLFKLCNELKIEIHPEKVRISKINKNFTFLKKRIFVTDTGKIIVKLSRQSLASERQRIKKHKHLLEKGQMTIDDVIQSYKSWRGWAKKFNNYKSLCDIDKRFMCAFNEYFRNSSTLSKQIFE